MPLLAARGRPAGPRAARPYACAAVIVRVRYVMPAVWAAKGLPGLHCARRRTYSWPGVCSAVQRRAQAQLGQSFGMIALAVRL